MAKKNSEIIKSALALAVISASGWLIFKGTTGFLGLEKLNDFWSIVIGLIGIFFATKLGLKKLVK